MSLPPGGAEDEDCLFLDIYVPSYALSGDLDDDEKFAVVVSIFGGAYVFGGKETVIKTDEQKWSLYDGQGIRDATQNTIIWVVPNYRLGTYGWLAGDTVEHHGSPNAALYDQRLVFQFVQAYIEQIGGDKDGVSAWGNSAGAGSIIHHLTAFEEVASDAHMRQGQASNLSSLIVSHVYNEAGVFVGPWVKTPKAFAEFLNLAFPGTQLQSIREAIEKRYPSTGPPFSSNQQARLREVLQDSTYPPAIHGSDLIPSTWHQGVNVSDLIHSFMWELPEGVTELLEAIIVPLAIKYQLYFAGHALFGDPNSVKPGQFPTWAISKDRGNTIDNALKVGLKPSGGQDPFFSVGPDPQSTSTNCDFWTKVAGEMNSLFKVAEKPEGGSNGAGGLFGLRVQEPVDGTLDTLEL
ncbi:MAG: hypothetical protein Q9203_003385 [Teloschistes exilis]